MKIGITIKLIKGVGPFVNGLGQNAIFLADVLSKVKEVTELYFIHFNKDMSDEEIQNSYYNDYYKVIGWKEAMEEIDVLVTLGMMPHEDDLLSFKANKDKRVIGYKGGNNLILSTEDLLFERKWGQKNLGEIKKGVAYSSRRDLYDEIWMVPQQEFHNKDYFEISFGCSAISTPFIWSPSFLNWIIEIERKIHPDFKILFEDREFDKWRVASIEPNTSILKNMMPILHSMEWAYLQNKDLYRQFNITNAKEFIDHPILIEIAKQLDIQKDGKLGFDPRWNIVVLLANYAEMIVSHQWGNPLNYAYLDTVYLGYPLIHNAHLCQDIGYYYKDFNLKHGGDMINKAALYHKNDKEYMTRNRQLIKRYMPTNAALIEQYSNLLMGLYDKDKKPKGQYNWETNLIE